MTTNSVPSTQAEITPTPTAVVWWTHVDALHRFVCDLVAAELTILRRSNATLPPLPWPSSLNLHDDLAVDSLEQLQLATALAETLHLHESGIADYLMVKRTVAEWVEVAQTGLDHFSLSMTFRTSGSTGIAKSCTHSLQDLWQETVELAGLLASHRRIFSAVPSHHIYGFLFTILLPQALKLTDLPIIDLRRSSPAAMRNSLRRDDLVIAHPAFWQAAAGVLSGVAEGVVGVTSTAPCPDEISAALRAAGLQRLLQIYGSSETAGIGWRDDETAPYALFEHWRRVPGQPNELMRETKAGSLVRVSCPDTLAWSDDRHFFPVGRLDTAVQVAGINVFPSRVRQILLQHPLVRDAAVRLMRSDEGNRLKAFIVPHDAQGEHVALQQELAAWVQKRLTAAERPKVFSFGTTCPTGPNGKDADWII